MKKKGLPGQEERTKGMESWKNSWLRKIFKIQQIILYQKFYLILIWTLDPPGAVIILYITDTPVCVKVCICLLFYFLKKLYAFIWAKMRICSWEQDLQCSSYLLLNMLPPHYYFGTQMWIYKSSLLGLIAYTVRANPEPSFTFHIFLPSHKFKEEGRGHEHGLWGQTPLCHCLCDLWQVTFFKSMFSYL